MTDTEFYQKMHRRIAQLAVGASALRNQGGEGLVRTCRDYFENQIDLAEFFNALSSETKYQKFLNEHTDAIVFLFPSTAKSWGAARKGLNLFFRDLTYNKYFADKFNLPVDFLSNNEKLKYLEVPLDEDVAKGLRRHFTELPRWDRIIRLTPQTSNIYQTKAQELATQENIARVHLDLVFWRQTGK